MFIVEQNDLVSTWQCSLQVYSPSVTYKRDGHQTETANWASLNTVKYVAMSCRFSASKYKR